MNQERYAIDVYKYKNINNANRLFYVKIFIFLNMSIAIKIKLNK